MIKREKLKLGQSSHPDKPFEGTVEFGCYDSLLRRSTHPGKHFVRVVEYGCFESHYIEIPSGIQIKGYDKHGQCLFQTDHIRIDLKQIGRIHGSAIILNKP
jgi:hypothetical protein